MRALILTLAFTVGCGATTATVQPLEWVEIRTGGASETDTLPLIVAMHGRGDRAEGFARTFEGFEVPARIALLRAPIREGDGDAWFTFRRVDTWRHVAEDLDAVSDRVARTIDAITASRPTRGLPVAVGFSQGGNLAYTLALRHPRRFMAIFPVSSGFIDEALTTQRFDVEHTPPIIALHGRQDEVIPVHVDRETVTELRGLGLSIELREHDAPHWINEAMRSDLQGEIARVLTAPP